MAPIQIAEVRRELESLLPIVGSAQSDADRIAAAAAVEGFFAKYIPDAPGDESRTQSIRDDLRDRFYRHMNTGAFDQEVWKPFVDDARRFNQEFAHIQAEAAQTRKGWLSFFRKRNKQDEQALQQAQQLQERESQLNEQELQARRRQLDARAAAIRRQQSQTTDPYFLIPPGKPFDYEAELAAERPLIDRFNERKAREDTRTPEQKAQDDERYYKITDLYNKRREAERRHAEAQDEAARREREAEIAQIDTELMALKRQEESQAAKAGRAPAAPAQDTGAGGGRKRILSAGHGGVVVDDVAEPTAQPAAGVPRAQVLRAAARGAGSFAKGAGSFVKGTGSALGSTAVMGARHLSRFSKFIFVLIYFATLLVPLWIGGGLFWPLSIAGVVLLAVIAQRELFNVDGLLFFLFLLGHIALISLGFPTGWLAVFWILLVAVIAGLFHSWMSEDFRDDLKFTMMLVATAVIIYALPTVLGEFVSESAAQAVTTILYVLPIAALVALSRVRAYYPDGYADRLIFWNKLLVGLALAYVLFTSLSGFSAVLPSGSLPGRDVKGDVQSVFTKLQESGTKTWKQITGSVDKITDPGAYYTGQVEQNKKKPLGVKIEGLRPSSKLIQNETEIVVYGNVRATSFMGKSVVVQPMCTLEGKSEPEASIDPYEMDILFGGSQSFECTFDPKRLTPVPQWKRGTYNVLATATFPFETWSYITYSFADEERLRNLERQGIDPKVAFKIPEQPTATFTSGPIDVGMGGSGQPVPIRPDKTPIIAPGTRIGVTVESGWEQGGRLKSVDRFEIKVPKPFVLEECDRGEPISKDEDIQDPQYTNYVFTNPEFADARTYSSITCKLAIPEAQREEARALVTQGDKVDRSFIAVVKYHYTVEQRTSVTVK